ncbi:MAG TPA: RagB/SusD family nutrient uptake outer membrane protein [Prolixibacteraceae bacterium]|nr:RagB/SusD family nutrient uptake outer membrane protein [Prolixibacteraceae bacterium]
MKKLLYIPLIAAAFIFQSCGEEFLDSKNLYEKLDVDYYKTPQDITEALTAVYSCLATDAGNQNMTLMANILSDDCLGGGGQQDYLFHDLDRFATETGEDQFKECWSTAYQGIFRANMIIYRFDQAEYKDEVERNQALGEAYFLRAYFYMKLGQFFGNVPLITKPEPVNYPKASADEIFGQVASDFKKAIELMAPTKFQNIPVERLGHATKWAAQGMMARAFLFYTGKYNKTEISLPEGGSVTKDQVVAWLDDCIANSGHGLLPDFRNQWPYAYAGEHYPYAKNNNLQWVGEEGGNNETVFAVKYSPYGNFNPAGVLSYCNQLVLYCALREQPSLIPWGNGWGAGPVNPLLWQSFEDNDVRKKGSIIDITDPEEGDVSEEYIWGGQNANGVEETGFAQKKYTPITIPHPETGAVVSMFYILYGGQNNMQLWSMQDEILLRFPDILLMAAELGSANAQTYFDRVRTRAGLASKPVSLDAIKLERRHELAFEGVRWFDLLRWHEEEAALTAVKNFNVKNIGIEEPYTGIYRSETNGFLPIPESEILLSEGVLEQNPGWIK